MHPDLSYYVNDLGITIFPDGKASFMQYVLVQFFHLFQRLKWL